MPTGSNNSQRYLILSIVLILALPLLFVNIKDSYDWGGDFAMYLKQTENIVKGVPQSATGYIYNENYSMLGPPAYTVGFPLLLTPVYIFYEFKIIPYNYYLTLMLIAFAVFSAVLISRYNKTASVLLPLLILYNPWTITFKSSIVADIPFALLLIVTILYLRTTITNKRIIPAALLTALLISIKGIGLVVLFAITIYHLLKYRKSKKQIIPILAYSSLSVFIFLFVNKVLIPLPSGDVYPYINPTVISELWYNFVTNSNYYLNVFQSFFNAENPFLQVFGNIMTPILVCLILFGMVKKMLFHFNIEDAVFIAFIFTLLIYPYGASGFRFLLPISTLVMLYLAFGITSLINNKKIQTASFVLLTAGYMALYSFHVIQIIKHSKNIQAGPQELYSVEAFDYIRSNTDPNDRFLFAKPRVLALYTGRASVANNNALLDEDILKLINEKGINNVLINDRISDQIIKDLVIKNAKHFEKEVINDDFTLYKVIRE
ncbi:MAG: hypothetical protein HKN22_04280 [Bacteroidia bacterium]|nr:hypothetical protein [Bacteroidia bacterium]